MEVLEEKPTEVLVDIVLVGTGLGEALVLLAVPVALELPLALEVMLAKEFAEPIV